MPNLEGHCKRTLKRYGVEGRDVHEWLDKPSRKYAGAHRQFRHDTETIRLVGEIFGKKYGKSLAENIALDHIMLDHEEEIKKHRTIVVNFPEEKEIPSIPCSYCNTLLKPSDQFCPNCGASRKEIVEEFDRAYEMEKIKLKEKRKKLRKELKLELALRELTPERRVSNWIAVQRVPEIEEDHLRRALLEKLVKEDFKRHPKLEERFHREIATSKRRKKTVYLLTALIFLFWVLIPAIYIETSFGLWLGYIWFFFWGIVFLVVLAMISPIFKYI